MANIENVKRAIAVMENVSDGQFNIRNWINERSHCGTVACFVGWLALSPEIPELALHKYYSFADKIPIYTNIWPEVTGANALARFLEIERHLAEDISGFQPWENWSHYYSKNLPDITPKDVIEKLKTLL